MRIALCFAAVLLAGCGSGPTPQEEALNETASGPEQLVDPAPGEPQLNAAVPSQALDVGDRAGIPGATQGPTQGDSDAPAMGDRGSGTGGDSTN